MCENISNTIVEDNINKDKEPYGWIYYILFPNDKYYIGLTTSLEERKRTHKSSARNMNKLNMVYKALRLHNMIDSFELIVIDTADNETELCEKEIGYILKYNSHYIDGHGYNMTYGGEGIVGYVRTEEDRQRARESQKNYFKNNPKAKELHIERLHRRRIENPVEAAKDQSEKMKRYYDVNTVTGMEARERARKRTQEQFEKPGSREKASELQKQRFDKPGEKERASEIQKKRYAKPGAIAIISEAAKRRHSQPGAKEKLLDQRGKNKPFDVYKNFEFIGSFTYQFQAHDYITNKYGIKKVDISAVLTGRLERSKGFEFIYK